LECPRVRTIVAALSCSFTIILFQHEMFLVVRFQCSKSEVKSSDLIRLLWRYFVGLMILNNFQFEKNCNRIFGIKDNVMKSIQKSVFWLWARIHYTKFWEFLKINFDHLGLKNIGAAGANITLKYSCLWLRATIRTLFWLNFAYSVLCRKG
jgi:hypothetical protein